MISYKENYCSEWFTVAATSYGADEGEGKNLDIDIDGIYCEPDKNTQFVIRSSYTGLVGAEPDSIEQASLPENPDLPDEANESYPKHQRLMVDVTDGLSGREIRVRYTWESKEANGISLTEDGKVTFTKAGTYHVRVKCGEYGSEWYEIKAANESKEYATIAFCDDDNTLIRSITLPWGTEFAPPADPTKEGYTFAGWSQHIPSKMPADDMSIYATWTKNEPESSEPGSKPAEKDTNPNTGAAIPTAAVMLCSIAAAMLLAVKRRKD